jgi:hypothetical protein
MFTIQTRIYNRFITLPLFIFALVTALFVVGVTPAHSQTTTDVTISASAQQRNQITITVNVTSADQVVISSFIGEGTNARALLGPARRVSGGLWQFIWDVTTVTPGTHRVFAVIVQGDSRSETRAISVQVGTNQTSGGTTTGSSTLPIPSVPTIPPVITSTESSAVAEELNSLSDMVTNLEEALEEEQSTAVLGAQQTINAAADSLPDSVRTEANSIKNDLEITITETREAVRDSVLEGSEDAEKIIREAFETNTEKYITQLEELAERTNSTIDTEGLRTTLSGTLEYIIGSAQQIEDAFKNRGGLLLYIDSDRDSVSDYDEQNIYGTNPQVTDSDGDGITDGDELLAGSNPLSAENAPIIYADPNTTGATTTAFKVTAASVAETHVVNGITTAKKIRFEGRSLPNSFVTIFIFSSPIVVTVKANAEGSWNYVLDKELPDGTHTIYVAAVDTTGKILAKSAPSPFIKQADAVELISLETVSATPSLLSTNSIILIVTAVIIFGVLALMYISHEHKKKEEEIRKLGGTTF